MNTWDGEYYKQHASAQEKRALKILKKIPFQGNEHILDIGCGDGKVTKYMAEKVPNGSVIGIDLSEGMIQQAKKEFKDISNLDFSIQNAEKFSFAEKFDLITSFNALHWVNSHEKVVERIKASLNEQGKVFLLMASGQKNPFVDQILSQRSNKSHFQRLFDFHDKMMNVDYEKLLLHQGFKIDELLVTDEAHKFHSVSDLQEHLLTWLPSVSDLPNQDCKKIAGEIATLIAKNTIDKSGAFSYFVSMLYVQAHLT